MKKRKYAARFHLMPPQGWLNDPNGLCQLNGVHHIFFQYAPEDPRGGQKYWGHFETRDFIRYTFTGLFLKPDCPEDRDGVYSGSAYVEDGEMYLYYTGNVKHRGDYDYIYSGREGNTLLVTSRDGRQASQKECLLKNQDYPENLSNHVRDPKVFKEGETYYMVLGARTRSDEGCVMLCASKDKRNWHFDHFIRKADFGYMWECPDLFELSGRQYLSLSPQGLAATEFKYQNVYQSGYFTTTRDLLSSGDGLGEFYEWDYGFDFYAPQTYEDERGRRLLIGWMGVPDVPYDHDPTIGEGWQHMLTLPRELIVDERTGRVLQTPARELLSLRKEQIYNGSSSEFLEPVSLPEGYELLLEGFADTDFELLFDGGFRVSYDAQSRVCSFLFLDESLGYGRRERKIRLLSQERVCAMRIFVDTCCMEFYINGGAYVFTTKSFREPEKKHSLSVKGKMEHMEVFELGCFDVSQE